ncbi:dTDP-4-dehydrorhamnose reductase [Mobilitalea sibirica]|uniref:dTDP-4-dehydrorhamnose reductase n=1 Tax=Mobilitalea sibirica TaxID=1462919 RepID=A0A8J7KWP5_9FIRM|nr:dTDP-4-dehydrorhamnose reductase [Mobilitalea sibirica]MBH1941590.1 dTDP-4-dehydrorhamnose reductase [Mobilitalea sibirica]
MKRILVTGALGQVGLAVSELLKDKTEYGLYLYGRRPSKDGRVEVLDITNEAEVHRVISTIKPHVIINCASMTAVDLCESEEEQAYNSNALGPKYLAEAADYIEAKLIHLSTDYVYDGQAVKPYTEGDLVGPINVYGRTKLEGELFVSKLCKRHFIIRTAWVYGEGKNFVNTMLRLAESGNKIRVVSDQYGSPTSAKELAKVIIFLMNTESYGLYHATCEGSTNWYEFAVTIFKEFEKDVEIEAISTAEYKTPAKRPMYSVLDNKELHERHGYYMKEWIEAFKEYVMERNYT